MKVIAYLEMSINGYIAKKNDETPWSAELWQSYQQMVKQVGNLIIGRKTYELMLDADEFSTIDNPFTIVITSQLIDSISNNIITAQSAKESLELMEKRGAEGVVIGGGAATTTLFGKENLIDELYLDIEPKIFGEGIPLFKPAEFNLDLELLETKQLSKNSIQLHYKVIK